MILRGAQIQRNGHGRCGLLLPISVLSFNRAEVPFSGVLGHAGTILCDLVIFRCRFRQGGPSLVRR
jgi:hypothetical protein